MFTQYVSKKREGSAGQQKKALHFFTSRKIVNVKTLADGQEVYIKAMIKSLTRPCNAPQLLCLKMEYPAKLTVVVQ